MKISIKYEEFIEKQIIDYINFSINESVNINSIWEKTVNKIKNLSNDVKIKVTKHLIASLLTFNASATIHNMIKNSSADIDTKNIAIQILNQESKKDKEDKTDIEELKDYESKWNKGYNFSLSKKGIEHIKNIEKLRLKAYDINDGMITIGYGHAEPIDKSKYKVGDIITKSEADDLLKDDLKRTEDGVRRIFKEWEEKKIDVKINQDMYDALVSIAFNSGVGGLRVSDFIQDIKRGNFKEAGDKIKNFNILKKFDQGLTHRRSEESKLFLNSI